MVRAYSQNIISRTDYEHLLSKCQQNMSKRKLGNYVEDPSEYMLFFDDNEQLIRGENGDYSVIVSIDALHAINRNLMDKKEYLQLVQDLDRRIQEKGFKHLALSGKYIKVLLRPLARRREDLFERNEKGQIEGTLVNFTLVKPPSDFYDR